MQAVLGQASRVPEKHPCWHASCTRPPPPELPSTHSAQVWCRQPAGDSARLQVRPRHAVLAARAAPALRLTLDMRVQGVQTPEKGSHAAPAPAPGLAGGSHTARLPALGGAPEGVLSLTTGGSRLHCLDVSCGGGGPAGVGVPSTIALASATYACTRSTTSSARLGTSTRAWEQRTADASSFPCGAPCRRGHLDPGVKVRGTVLLITQHHSWVHSLTEGIMTGVFAEPGASEGGRHGRGSVEPLTGCAPHGWRHSRWPLI